jgi:serine/threonine-protein kinase
MGTADEPFHRAATRVDAMNTDPITSARLKAIQHHFEAALERDAESRALYLRDLAGQDVALAQEVTEFLRAHDQADDRLASPISADLLRSLGEERDDDRWIGARVGAYRIVRRIGVGGMGAVYEGMRDDDEFAMRVAIKVLRRSVESSLAVQRFRRERQILASLSHRNIAALLDGGMTEEGQPYLVMEFVDGIPITRWCDARHLDIAGRLQLMRQVCGAVRHAHQQLVVHRDLKPGNILVSGDGTVKLLDFGIAKLLDDGATDPEDLPSTIGGPRAFTPDYAAPEQVRGLPVGTAADVYALGGVLFELLTGKRPFPLTGRTLAEIEQVVCHEPAPRPSTVISTPRETALGERSLARARAAITGDLDAIVGVALRKEPDRRYSSAETFALDLSRHLDGLPVDARPEGVGYRLGKFVRRRWIELAAASVAVLSLIGGLVATTREARAANRERQRAESVTTFLTAMLAAPNPAEAGRDVTMRDVLDSAVIRADSLAGRPDIEADVRTVIAETYLGLGEFDRALTEYHKALDATRRAHPAGGRPIAMALSRLGTGLERAGDYAAADSIVGMAIDELGLVDELDPVDEVNWLDQRGRLRAYLGDAKGAVQLLAEALPLQIALTPDNDSAIAYSYLNLAVATGDALDYVGSDTLFRVAARRAARAFGDRHPMVAAIASAHGSALEAVGRPEAADSAYRLALRLREDLLGPTHPDYAWSMFNYADFLLRTKRYPEAVEWGRKVVALRGVSLPETHPAVGTGLQVLGRALGFLGELPEAEGLLRESLAIRSRMLPEGHWLITSSESVLGEHLTLAGRYPEAERILLAAHDRLVALRGRDSYAARDTRDRLRALYTAWGRPTEAAAWAE